jgi:hypothetical protein
MGTIAKVQMADPLSCNKFFKLSHCAIHENERIQNRR